MLAVFKISSSTNILHPKPAHKRCMIFTQCKPVLTCQNILVEPQPARHLPFVSTTTRLGVQREQSVRLPGTSVQYPGLQGDGALGDASTPDMPIGSIAASAHGGTYSHVAKAGGAWGGERGAAATAAAAVARRRRATLTGGAVTSPRSAPAHGGRGGGHGARAGGWDLPRAKGRL